MFANTENLFEKKLKFETYVCESVGKNFSFSENFAYVLYGWFVNSFIFCTEKLLYI